MNITKQRLNQIIQEELQTMIDYETSKWMGKPQRYSTDRGISLRATQDHEDDVDRYAQQSAKDANERRHYRERPPGADHAARKANAPSWAWYADPSMVRPMHGGHDRGGALDRDDYEPNPFLANAEDGGFFGQFVPENAPTSVYGVQRPEKMEESLARQIEQYIYETLRN